MRSVDVKLVSVLAERGVAKRSSDVGLLSEKAGTANDPRLFP